MYKIKHRLSTIGGDVGRRNLMETFLGRAKCASVQTRPTFDGFAGHNEVGTNVGSKPNRESQTKAAILSQFADFGAKLRRMSRI